MQCDGDSCKFNCSEEEKSKCCDPLNKTIRQPVSRANLLEKDNPFEFLEKLESPTQKEVAQETRTDRFIQKIR